MSRSALQSSVYDAIYPWQFGSLGLVMKGASVQNIDFLESRSIKSPKSKEARKIIDILECYLASADSGIGISVNFVGTEFQKKVWQALRTIDVGQVVTYGELARQLGSSPRAIGGACRKNPVPVLVPCHRVISASGLGGFAGKQSGKMMDIKRWLLEHEGLEIN